MLMLTEKKERKKPNLSENHKLMEQSIEQETKRWQLHVLLFMFVTAAVTQFEMSALNAAAKRNAVGV